MKKAKKVYTLEQLLNMIAFQVSLDWKVELKGDQLHIRAQFLTVKSEWLLWLHDLTQGYEITLGRSGANFRMIIS